MLWTSLEVNDMNFYLHTVKPVWSGHLDQIFIRFSKVSALYRLCLNYKICPVNYYFAAKSFVRFWQVSALRNVRFRQVLLYVDWINYKVFKVSFKTICISDSLSVYFLYCARHPKIESYNETEQTRFCKVTCNCKLLISVLK